MNSPHLDEKSLSALRFHRAFKIACIISLGVQAINSWAGPRWIPAAAMWVALGCIAALVIFGIGAVLFARRVRCPHCANSALVSFAPSWRKTQLGESKGNMHCAYCHEHIDYTQ